VVIHCSKNRSFIFVATCRNTHILSAP